jgi:hypothetical protein
MQVAHSVKIIIPIKYKKTKENPSLTKI